MCRDIASHLFGAAGGWGELLSRTEENSNKCGFFGEEIETLLTTILAMEGGSEEAFVELYQSKVDSLTESVVEVSR